VTLWCHCCGRPAFGPDELVSDGDPVPCGCPCDSETPAYIAGAEDPCPVCEREAIRDVWVDGPDCEAARAARERALVLAYHDELAASQAREQALRVEVDRMRRVAWGVVHNARNTQADNPDEVPRWACVRDAVGCGSTQAHALCREFGLDPDDAMAREDGEK
jgi:hypothetical protein